MLVEERALGLDLARELIVQALGVVARVGGRALGEEHAHLLARALPLRGRGVRRGRDLVGREAGLGGASQHLRDDARRAPRGRGGGAVRSATRPSPPRVGS